MDGLRVLTVQEVADELRVSKMTVYRMVHSGEIRSMRVGRSIRITEEAWREYLDLESRSG